MTIPHSLIQTWKTKIMPEEWKDYQRSWQRHHPHWSYTLSDDDENRKFVQAKFPQYLRAYDALPYPINRVDFIRYMWMYIGGWYADGDTECFKCFDDLCCLPNGKVILASPINSDWFVECALMGSVPKHPLWIYVLEEINNSVFSPTLTNQTAKFINNSVYVLSLTGPLMLSRVLRKCRGLDWYNQIYILDRSAFYPLAWYDNPDTPHSVFLTTSTYARHRMANTWVNQAWEHRLGGRHEDGGDDLLFYRSL